VAGAFGLRCGLCVVAGRHRNRRLFDEKHRKSVDSAVIEKLPFPGSDQFMVAIQLGILTHTAINVQK
jgi:hypothetical protein